MNKKELNSLIEQELNNLPEFTKAHNDWGLNTVVLIMEDGEVKRLSNLACYAFLTFFRVENIYIADHTYRIKLMSDFHWQRSY